MAKQKLIKEDLVETYIENERQLKVLLKKHDDLKFNIMLEQAKGRVHPLLQFIEATTWRPKWKELVEELTDKFLTPSAKRVYFNKLHKRYPRKPVATRVNILLPEFESKRKDPSSDEEE